MNRRRVGLALIFIPLAAYAYACSSDPDPDAGGPDSGTTPDGGGNQDTGVNPPQDSGSQDTGVPTDAGGDADAAPPPPVCIGNPLAALPDAGVDGGETLDAAVSQRIVTVAAGNFLDGPQWVEGSAFFVFSEFNQNERIRRVNIDGGGLADLRTAGFGDDVGPIGNAIRNGLLITTGSAKTGAGTSGIYQSSLTDGGARGVIPVGAAVSPNDLVVGANGTIYFTDPRYQTPGNPTGIYRTNPDGGGATAITTFNGGEEPNGIALSPDGTKLYVAFHAPKRVDAYPVNNDGTVTGAAVTILDQTQLTDSPDGIAVDVGGNLWIAEADADTGVNSGRVEVFKVGALPANAVKWGEIPFPTTRPTGVAFGGPDRKTVMVTVETGVFVYKGRCAGVL